MYKIIKFNADSFSMKVDECNSLDFTIRKLEGQNAQLAKENKKLKDLNDTLANKSNITSTPRKKNTVTKASPVRKKATPSKKDKCKGVDRRETVGVSWP